MPTMRWSAPGLIGSRPLPVFAMEIFTKLFGNLLAFVYHCFDCIVIHGYLSALSRPEQVVHFFRQVLGIPVVSKEILSQRTADYQNWVEAFARNHHTPIVWAEKGVRKEDYVLPWLRRMLRRNAYGVFFIFKSMEQGPSFRITTPKFPTKDPNHRILARQKSRFTHDYFYIRDEVLGPMVMLVATFFPFQTTYYLNGHSFIEQELNRAKVDFRKNDNAFLAVDDVAALQAAADRLSPEIIRKRLDYWTLILGPKFSAKERKQLNLSRFYAISQIEYCRNFIFKRNFPIHKLFERSCELGLWRLTANKIAEIYGTRLHRRHRGKLATVIDQIEHGHHVFRAYFKSAFLKQYEKFSTFLRNELCSNNLTDFGLKLKGWTTSMRSVRPSKPSPTVSPASRRNGSTSTSTFLSCSGLPCPSSSARSAILASKSTIRVSFAYARFSCMAALTSAVGHASRSIRPSSPPSISPIKITVSTNSATTCANLRVTALSSVMDPATPTASPRRVSRSRCCFYSSTNVCADHSPTATSTTSPTQNIAHTANSKPPTTAPTRPSIKLSNCWQPPERHTADLNVKAVLSKNREVRI